MSRHYLLYGVLMFYSHIIACQSYMLASLATYATYDCCLLLVADVKDIGHYIVEKT